jgi:RNA polymerase sigma-70 factor (ECF subfamily)
MTHAEFQQAYWGHKDVVYRFARRVAGSTAAAEDVVQETFLALWNNSAAYRPDRGTLRSFLIGIARHRILQGRRGERPYDELEDDCALTAPIDPAGLERAEMIARAVAALPPLQREVLVLAEYEDLSLDEISRATEAELAAVKSRLHRARENLRRALAPLLEGERTTHGTKR